MTDARTIANLFQDHRAELGFVNIAQVREKTTYTVEEHGELLGAALCNHCVRKPQTTLYDIAVRASARRHGVGQSLIDQICSDTPHDVIVAKCPTNLDATAFYEATGWERTDTERRDDKRDLYVYEYNV